MSDLETLEALNRDYISSVQNGDVRRFDEILAPEFYCSNPDGSLVDIFRPSRFRNSLAGTSYGRRSPPTPRSMPGQMIVWNGMLSLPMK